MSSTVEVFSECMASAIELTRKVKFDADNIQHLYPVALYSSILELCDECIYLVREGPKPGIAILSRSILEAFVNLKNATDDSSYIEYIEFEWLKSWHDLMDEAEKGNHYLKKIAEDDGLIENRETYRKRLDELKEKGIRKLQVFEKFEKADLANEYRTIYGFMSSHSHGGMQALMDKHIDVSSGRPEVSAFIDCPIEAFEIYLGTSCEILMQATELFHVFLESGLDDEVQAMRTKIDEHRKLLESAE